MNDGLFDYGGCCVYKNDIAGLDLRGCEIADESVSRRDTFADEYVDLLDQVSLCLILRG